jgi:hypothetical protein
LIFDKGARKSNGKRKSFSKNTAVTIEYPYDRR